MGAKVRVNPTDEVITASVREFEVIDKVGRKITLKKPGILAQYRIMETVGAETAANSTYMMMVLPVLYVAAIDGDPIEFPVRKLQLEALIQRLDEHGIDTVMRGVQDNFGAADPAAEADALKKSDDRKSSATASGS